MVSGPIKETHTNKNKEAATTTPVSHTEANTGTTHETLTTCAMEAASNSFILL
mgnify:CR=1 FL=1